MQRGNNSNFDSKVQLGLVSAISAYLLWGFVPIYFRLVDHIGALQIVAHRIIWSVVFVGLFLVVTNRIGEIFAAFKNLRTILLLCSSSVAVTFNWLVFVYGVETAQILAVSLGYFINPLVSVAIGMILLSERQQLLQTIAIFVAGFAVAIQTYLVGELPLISLSLAFSFAIYGYLRKHIQVSAFTGIFIETLLMLPFAIVFLIFWGGVGGPIFGYSVSIWPLLMGLGFVTSVPLILFAVGARHLRLTTLGILQYIAPSIHFLVAIFLFGEQLTIEALVTFVLIWISLILYSYSSFRTRVAKE